MDLELKGKAAWQKAIQQNLMSVIRACGAAIPHMRKAGGGRIINITAISARQPAAGFGLSVATWAGLIGNGLLFGCERAVEVLHRSGHRLHAGQALLHLFGALREALRRRYIGGGCLRLQLSAPCNHGVGLLFCPGGESLPRPAPGP